MDSASRILISPSWSSASNRKRWTCRSTLSCFNFKCPQALTWKRRDSSHGAVRAEIRRWPRPDPPAGSLSRIGEGAAGAIFAAGVPDLFDQAAHRGGSQDPGPAQEAQPGKVFDLQPAVCNPGAGGPSDPEIPRLTGG